MCAKRSPLRAQRCAARGQRLCVRRPTRPRMWQVLREQEGARVYSELQSKHRAAYGDDEAAREAAGKAALLRAKESLSTGWAARLCCEQRGRLAAARLPQLRGVRQRVLAVESARECAPERATRERSRFQSASVCVCGHSRARGACSRPRTNATVSACSRLRTNAEIAGVNARVPWTNAIVWRVRTALFIWGPRKTAHYLNVSGTPCYDYFTLRLYPCTALSVDRTPHMFQFLVLVCCRNTVKVG